MIVIVVILVRGLSTILVSDLAHRKVVVVRDDVVPGDKNRFLATDVKVEFDGEEGRRQKRSRRGMLSEYFGLLLLLWNDGLPHKRI